MTAKKAVDMGAVSVQVGTVRRQLHLALSELGVDVQQHGAVRDDTKQALKDAQSALNELVKAAEGAEVAEAVDQNQPVPGQASVPDVPSQP